MARNAHHTKVTTITSIAAVGDGPPELPAGRRVRLPGRGETFVRELPGPAGAPTLVLLHGWTATADLNWFTSFAELGRTFRVVALDHHGHGQGVRRADPFTLAGCADDVAALAGVLGISRMIVVGYSMGGPIAQLTWKRHPHLVAGVVLCATSRVFNVTPKDRVLFESLEQLGRLARHSWSQPVVQHVLRALGAAKARTRLPGAWTLRQIARHCWLDVLEAGRELGRFDSRSWLAGLDVPAAVVTTLQDEVVPLDRQVAMAATLPDATVHPIEAGHAACYDVDVFVPALIEACRSVATRAAALAGSMHLAA